MARADSILITVPEPLGCDLLQVLPNSETTAAEHMGLQVVPDSETTLVAHMGQAQTITE